VQVLALVTASTAAEDQRAVAVAVATMRRHAEVRLTVTDGPDDLRHRLAESAADRLVVLGGDGSVQALAQALHDTGRLRAAPPVALVPLGTGNDLARGLGLPLDPAEAGTVAVTGTARRASVLLDDDDRVVVNVVHVGAGAEATARTASKSLLGRWAYHVGAFVTGLRARGWHLRVTVDGRAVHDGERRVLMAALAVGRTIGGGAPIAPGADPSDDVAEVVVSLATGYLARVGYAVALRLSRHERRDDVLHARGRRVTVEALHGDRFRSDADGELAGPFASRSWRVVPGAWRLVVPAAPGG
jgi:diacylglycerol kinase family enzyme